MRLNFPPIKRLDENTFIREASAEESEVVQFLVVDFQQKKFNKVTQNFVFSSLNIYDRIKFKQIHKASLIIIVQFYADYVKAFHAATQKGFGYTNIANCEFRNVRKAPEVFSYKLPQLDPTIEQICSTMETSDTLSVFEPLVFITLENLTYLSANIQNDLLAYANKAKFIQIVVNRHMPVDFKVNTKAISKISKFTKITLRIGAICGERYPKALKLLKKKNIHKLIFEENFEISAINSKRLNEAKEMLESLRNLTIKELDI